MANRFTTSLYLRLPLLWSIMMAWAGVHIGRSTAAATSLLSTRTGNVRGLPIVHGMHIVSSARKKYGENQSQVTAY